MPAYVDWNETSLSDWLAREMRVTSDENSDASAPVRSVIKETSCKWIEAREKYYPWNEHTKFYQSRTLVRATGRMSAAALADIIMQASADFLGWRCVELELDGSHDL